MGNDQDFSIEEQNFYKNNNPFCLQGGLTLVPMPGLQDLAKSVAQYIQNKSAEGRKTKVDIATPEFFAHSNNDLGLKLGKTHIGDHDVFVLASACGDWQGMCQLFKLLDHIAGRHPRRITVIFGYFPLSRSDKDEGELEFALPAWVVRSIEFNCQGLLDRIIAFDLHSPQIVMAGRAGQVTEVRMIRKLLSEAFLHAQTDNRSICLSYPDDTASKRTEHAFKKDKTKLQYPKVFGQKRRSDSANTELVDVVGRTDSLNQETTVIAIDDEAASCGSQIDIATYIKKQFSVKSFWTVITHGVFCQNAADRLLDSKCPIDKVFCSDTIPVCYTNPKLKQLREMGKLVIVPIYKEVAWIVYHMHWGQSIRKTR